MVEGMGSDAAVARQRVLAGKLSGQAIDTPAAAFSEALTAFSGDLARLQRAAPPIALVQVARYANPQNSSATVLLALILASQQRANEALAALHSMPRGDAWPRRPAISKRRSSATTSASTKPMRSAAAAAARRRGSERFLAPRGRAGGDEAQQRSRQCLHPRGRAWPCAGAQGRSLAVTAAAGKCAGAGRSLAGS